MKSQSLSDTIRLNGYERNEKGCGEEEEKKMDN